MKKGFLLIGCLCLLAVSIVNISCKKDEEWKGCSCTQVDYDGYRSSYTVTAAEAKQYGAESCGTVAGMQKMYDYEAMTVNCSDL